MLPSELTAFVHAAIKSVWALELLLQLRARQIETVISIASLVADLRVSEFVINDTLAIFRKAGLITQEPSGVRYAPVKPELDRLVTLLAGEYARRPLTVINEIYADQRGLQNLADAFRFKGPK